MDEWAWEQLQPWLEARPELPVGPLFCVINGPPRADATGRVRPPEWSCAERRPPPACVARPERPATRAIGLEDTLIERPLRDTAAPL